MIKRSLLLRVAATLVLLATAIGSIVVAVRAGDPLQNYAITNPPFESLTYSIQVFLWWDDNAAGTHLDWVRLMGFSHVKQIFAWEDVEAIQGEYHWQEADRIVNEVERRGLGLIVRLSDAPRWAHPDTEGEKDVDYHDAPPDPEHMAAWGRYCGSVAERYRGRIAAYQIWNEPNLEREWGNQPPDAAGYVALLRECSTAIRAADPDAIVISAGLSPTGTWTEAVTPDDLYLRGMYAADFQQYVDVVGMHAPGYSAASISPDDAVGGQRWATFRRVEDLRRIMIENGDAARQAAILEFGYTRDNRAGSDYAWFAVPDAQTQGERLAEGYAYAAEHWRPWVGLMSMIYIHDPQWTQDDEELWWSITVPPSAELYAQFPGGFTTEALGILGGIPKFCGDRIIPAVDPNGPIITDPMLVPNCRNLLPTTDNP